VAQIIEPKRVHNSHMLQPQSTLHADNILQFKNYMQLEWQLPACLPDHHSILLIP